MDVIDRFNDVMVANGIDENNANRISEAVRREYCGGFNYIAKRSETEREKIFADIKNNIPSDKIAKKYRISKITVYRMMRKIKEARL